MDNLLEENATQYTEEFIVKNEVNYDAEIQIKPEYVDVSMYTENKNSPLIKLEPVESDDSKPVKSNSLILPLSDLKPDVFKEEIPKNILNEPLKDFFNEGHYGGLIQDNKIEVLEHHLKKEFDYFNIEETFKKETFKEDQKKFNESFIFDRLCFERSENIKSSNSCDYENRELNDDVEVQDTLDKSNKCEYVTQHSQNHKILNGDEGDDRNQDKNLEIDEQSYHSSIYDFKTINKPSLKSHLEVHPGKYLCQICNKKFLRKYNLDRHIVSMHSENKKIMESVTSTIRKCDICEYKSVTGHDITRHMEIHNIISKQTYLCNLCDYKTTNERNLKRHLKVHINTHSRHFSCQLCDKRFKTKRNLDCHIVSVHPENKKMMDFITHKIYKCNICEFKTGSNDHFKRHLRGHKSIKTEQTYQCDICGYKTEVKHYLTRHVKVHAGERGFLCYCHICDKNFIKKQHLDCHIVSRHSKNKSLMDSVISKIYKCDKCELKTASIDYFRRHLRMHKSVKAKQTYQCDICGYKTIVKDSLRSHIQLHASGRRFLCHICDMKFSKKQNLVRHVVSMHSDNKEMMDNITCKIYKCDMCEYKTTVSCRFKRHLKTHKRVKIKQI